MDGYDALAPWGVRFHGVIDGASRRIVALNATDSKFPAPVTAFMIAAIVANGVPHKIRADKGTENVGVKRVAALLREAGYKIKYIEGQSIRNQRIERW